MIEVRILWLKSWEVQDSAVLSSEPPIYIKLKEKRYNKHKKNERTTHERKAKKDLNKQVVNKKHNHKKTKRTTPKNNKNKYKYS